jgi:hypothetical protein
MEIIFELFGELILQVVGSVLGEIFSAMFGNGVANISGWRPPPVVKALLYLVTGCGLAWVSLLVMPHAYARSMDVRLAVLIGSPLACGVIMGFYTAWRSKSKHAGPFSFMGFFYGVLFAAPMAVGRFIYAN